MRYVAACVLLLSAVAADAPDPGALDALVRSRQSDLVTYEDWTKVDALELSNGEAAGRPRVKFTSRAEIKKALS